MVCCRSAALAASEVPEGPGWDSSGRPDVVRDVEVILGELDSFGAHLAEKPMIMVASKVDVANKDKLAKLKRYCKKHGLLLFPISAVTGKGIEELKYAMAEKVEELRERSRQELAGDVEEQFEIAKLPRS